jgi:glycosyltransferase involved in cell wall biosynthesis
MWILPKKIEIPSGKFGIKLKFGLSSKNADFDNPVKPFIDVLQKKYSFIRLYRNDTNAGVTGTFENSVRMCKGDFIAISDQDDIWDKEKIEYMMQETGKEDAYFCNSLLVDQSGNTMNKTFSSVMKMQSYYSGAAFLTGVCVPGHNILMKRSFAELIIPFPKNIMFDRWISYCAAANKGLKYIDKSLVRYRQHDANTFGIKKSGKKKRLSAAEKYNIKLNELNTMADAPISDDKT